MDDDDRRGFGVADGGDDKSLAVGGNVEADQGVDGGAGFGADFEERGGRAESGSLAELDGNSVNLAVESKIEDFFAVAAPADDLGAGAGDGESLTGNGGIVTAGEGLEIEFGPAGFV